MSKPIKVVTKAEYIDCIAKETKLAKTEVCSVFESMTSILAKSLKSGSEVKFPFGKIKIVDVKSKKGVNPATGKSMIIPACKKPKFVFSKDFKLMFKK